MSIIFDEVARRHAKEFILLVFDGAGWHQAADLRVPNNERVVRLLPYSPELNTTEHRGRRSGRNGSGNLAFQEVDEVLETAL